MNHSNVKNEFQELQNEIRDEDPIVRGMAAVDLGAFALEHPDYKDQIVSLLEQLLDDPDSDVRSSAKASLDQIHGKQPILDQGKQIIAFGYVPEEYRQPEVDQKQMILSCVCCIIMIVAFILMFIYLF